MKLSTLQELERNLMTELVRRRSLGGYSADAESLIFITEALHQVVRHLVDDYPVEEPKKKASK